MKLRLLGALLAVTIALAVVVLLTSPVYPATVPTESKVCRIAWDLAPKVPPSIDRADVATATSIAGTLDGIAKAHAPANISRAAATLARGLRAIAHARNDTARKAAVAKHAQAYLQAFTLYNTYRTKYCPAPVTSGKIANIGGASDTACLADAATIRMAEDLYSSVNGTYLSLPGLVSAGFLRTVSSYYADVTIDDPPGGYTLIAVPSGPCANLPVAG